MRHNLTGFVLGAWLALFGVALHCLGIPSKPVRIIVPFAPPVARQTFTRALLASACRIHWGSRWSSTIVRAQARSSAPMRWPKARPMVTRC